MRQKPIYAKLPFARIAKSLHAEPFKERLFKNSRRREPY